MFRLIKKWYFKIYHLLKFLGIFVLIFGLSKNVYAEEYKECFNKYLIGEVSFSSYNTRFYWIKNYIPIEPNKTYYIKFFTEENYTGTFANNISYYNNNKEGISEEYQSNISFNKNKQILTIPTKNIENSKYIRLKLNITVNNYQVLEGKKMIISDNIDDVETCTEEPPTPEENKVYSNFLTLYIDRLNYLADGSTNNPYLFTMIGIIFAWIVLELFIKILHLKGGKYK